MDAQLTKALFDESCKKIVDHMHQLFRHPSVKDVSSILLVGGFAESPMLQEAVKEAFSELKVIVPQDAGLAVLRVQYCMVTSQRPFQVEFANIHMAWEQ